MLGVCVSRAGFVTQTDVDMGALVLKHELPPGVVNDVLQLVQDAVHRAQEAEEPFAMDYKGLKQRMRVVQELAAVPAAAARGKPTAAAVRGRARG